MARVRVVRDVVWLRGERWRVEELGVEIDSIFIISIRISRFQGEGEEREKKRYVLLIINKPDMAPIDNNTGIPIEKVLQMEDRREPHWSCCKGSNKIRMAGG